MTDDLVDTLRHLDATEYPGRGDRLDPALVVHAGRRRRAARRAAGTTAACAVVAALAFGVPPLVDRASRPVAPVTSPNPSASAATTVLPMPSASPTTFPGVVTTMPATGLTDPVDAGVLTSPAALEDVEGLAPSIVGSGDGTVLPVALTPTAYEPETEVFPAYRSGLGLWTPGGSIDWVVAPPVAPELGPQTVEATVDASWVVWFESDFSNWLETPYALWARPRNGGEPRQIAASQTPPEDVVAHAIYDHHPVIVGDTLFWYDEVFDTGTAAGVMLGAPLDGSGPARITARDVLTMAADRCAQSAEPALFLVTGTDATGRQELHRITVDPATGTVRSDRTVREDLLGTAETVSGVAACGDTVAVAHDIDDVSAERGSWLEIDHGDDTPRTFVWPDGTGSSVGDLAVGPGVVTWHMVNGRDNDTVYLYDLATQTLREFSARQARNLVTTDGTFVWWLQPAPESDTYRTAVARVAAS